MTTLGPGHLGHNTRMVIKSQGTNLQLNRRRKCKYSTGMVSSNSTFNRSNRVTQAVKQSDVDILLKLYNVFGRFGTTNTVQYECANKLRHSDVTVSSLTSRTERTYTTVHKPHSQAC